MKAEKTPSRKTPPIPSGWKRSDVGVIPETWELRPLLSTLLLPTGQVDPRHEPYRSMVLVAPDHIESGTGRLLAKATAWEQGAISGKYVFTAGDIVYSKIRPYLRKAILADFGGLCSADMYPLSPVTGVSGGFMLAVLLGHRFSTFAESVSVRSGMPKINRDELAEFSVALPPLPEQRAIAAALSDVDQLIGALDKLIAKKRAIKLAAMQQLLTGKTRLPGFSAGWEVRSLGDLFRERGASCKTGPFGTLLKASEYCEEGLLVVSVGELGAGRIQIQPHTPAVPPAVARRLPEYILRRGDIVFGRKGAVDRSALVDADNKYFLGSDGIRVRLPECCDPAFVSFQLQSSGVRNWLIQNAIGTTMASLNQAVLARVSVLLPPQLAEQTSIARILSAMDAEITALEQRRDKTKAIKQGMMQVLLTGRVRLVKPERGGEEPT